MKTLNVREIVEFYHDRHSEFAPSVSLVHLRELLRERDEAVKGVTEWKTEAERLASILSTKRASLDLRDHGDHEPRAVPVA